MSEEYLDFIILLEKTLADFYKQYRENIKFISIKPILEFMESHSETHAITIGELKSKIEKPVLNSNIILKAHNNLTVDVKEKISNEKKIKNILQILADSEEDVGKLYFKIADHIDEVAKYYNNLSEEIRKIAEEENDHRDLLISDKDNMK